MRAQFQSMGLSLDWSREIATCDPAYYRHEQAMFLDFLEAGLVYRKESWVNWDPVDQTVLANEQVIDGRGWRSGAVVERRKLAQWFFKITEYSQELLDALAGLDRWPRQGAPDAGALDRPLRGRAGPLRDRSAAAEPLEVFTTRPDTLFGASFMALAPDHPLSIELADEDPGVAAFVAECARTATSEEALEQAEKVGYDTGLRCRNPLDPGSGAADLRRQLRADGLRHRRDLRLSGARPARSGVRAQIRPAGRAGGAAAGRRRRSASRSATRPTWATAG